MKAYPNKDSAFHLYIFLRTGGDIKMTVKRISLELWEQCKVVVLGIITHEGIPEMKGLVTPISCIGLKTFYFDITNYQIESALFELPVTGIICYYSQTIFKSVTLKGCLNLLTTEEVQHIRSTHKINPSNKCKILKFTSQKGTLYSDYQTYLFDI